MKFVVAIVAAFLIFEANCFAVPAQDQQIDSVTSQNLERVKRGCSCGPYGCSCSLRDTDESFLKAVGADELPDELKRSKRGGCFCGPNGCGCSLRAPEENEDIHRSKRSADVETVNEATEFKRFKRGCSCGPYGCSCSLRDTDESDFKAVSADEFASEFKRSKRGGCFCGPNGCGCTLREPEN